MHLLRLPYPGYVSAIIEGGVKIVETAGNNPAKWLPANSMAYAPILSVAVFYLSRHSGCTLSRIRNFIRLKTVTPGLHFGNAIEFADKRLKTTMIADRNPEPRRVCRRLQLLRR